MAQETQGQFGGRVTFKFGTQFIVIAEAEVKIDPATFDVSARPNQDGTAAYEMKPVLVGADVEFRNVGDVDWNAILLQIGNVTIVEETNGRTHLFTGTRLVGKPQVNVSTGIVSGLRVEGGQYQMTPLS